MKAFIIGGGNSITPETYEKLKNRSDGDIIAINRTYKFITPDALVWLDPDVYFKNKEEIDSLKCKKYSRRFEIYPSEICQIDFTPEARQNSITSLYAGKNGILSGFFAISLALVLGYDEIYLLGFDGGEVDGKLHHHDMSIDKDKFSLRNKEYEPFRGKPIYNLSPDSKITVFDKKRLVDVLD